VTDEVLTKPRHPVMAITLNSPPAKNTIDTFAPVTTPANRSSWPSRHANASAKPWAKAYRAHAFAGHRKSMVGMISANCAPVKQRRDTLRP
jgi:hypothetical protein